MKKQMLTFSAQQKILGAILKKVSNYQCADCNTISPTWASLDFGVFICSNCAGGHRSLGPTVTRVKSTKLDSWNQQWLQNMQIGNKELNEYWEAKLTISTKKPKMGSSLEEVNRYVNDKYLKRKYAATGIDPLKKRKLKEHQGTDKVIEQQQHHQKSTKLNIQNEIHKQKQKQKQQPNLWDFNASTKSEGRQKCIIDEDEEFGSYNDTPQITPHKQLTYHDLLKQQNTNQKNTLINSNSSHQLNYIHSNTNYHQINNYHQTHLYPQNNQHLNHQHINNLHQNSIQNNHQNNHQTNLHTQNYLHYQPLQNYQNRGIYHSLNHQSPYVTNNNQSCGLYGQGHNHHYHNQNLTGITGTLPINAKYPGEFTPITLQTFNHNHNVANKLHKQEQSWVNSWK